MEQRDELSFEEAMAQLEKIVKQLEEGDVPLEKSIALFQTGMELSKFCSQKLEHVEKKIDMLLEEDGQLQKKNFQHFDEELGE